MGLSGDYSVIVLLIIIGVMGVFGMVWGAFSLTGSRHTDTSVSRSDEQSVYQRDVRLRHMRDTAGMVGRRDVVREMEMALHGYGDEQRGQSRMS